MAVLCERQDVFRWLASLLPPTVAVPAAIEQDVQHALARLSSAERRLICSRYTLGPLDAPMPGRAGPLTGTAGDRAVARVLRKLRIGISGTHVVIELPEQTSSAAAHRLRSTVPPSRKRVA